MNTNTTGIMMIVAACAIVLLIGALRSKAEWIINFILRAVAGTIAIYLINQILDSSQIALCLGLNPITVLTSGFLGFPGLILLYGINLYCFL